jgi:hypothetical protein
MGCPVIDVVAAAAPTIFAFSPGVFQGQKGDYTQVRHLPLHRRWKEALAGIATRASWAELHHSRPVQATTFLQLEVGREHDHDHDHDQTGRADVPKQHVQRSQGCARAYRSHFPPQIGESGSRGERVHWQLHKLEWRQTRKKAERESRQRDLSRVVNSQFVWSQVPRQEADWGRGLWDSCLRRGSAGH